MPGACRYSAAQAPPPPSPFSALPSPRTLRRRHDAPPFSPPCRAPGTQRGRKRVSGETWLLCLAACARLWTARAFGRCRLGVVFLDREEKNGEEPLAISAFALVWLWLHSSGCFWWDRWLCKNRVASLAAGLLFGSLAGLGSYQMSQDPRNVWVFLAATSVTFVGVLGLRSYYYGKVMPFADGRQSWSSYVDDI
uniref:Uncharacterized protein n=1 Tax=Papio anubis TaxID=9555 RepID=A0A8I5R8G5_PAPAN